MSDSQGSENQRSSVADILAKMKEAGEWDGDLGFGQEDSKPAPAAETPGVQPQPQTNSPQTQPSGESTDVNQYMNQLMNRYTEHPEEGPQAETPQGLPPSDSDETVRLPADEMLTPEFLSGAAPAQVMQLLKENEYRPSQVAAEKGKNLDALRQLANESARTAVKEHQDREFQFMKTVRIGMTVAAVVAAVALFMVSKSWSDPMMYAALGVTMIAMFSGGMIFVTRNANNEDDKKSEPVEADKHQQ